MIKIAVAGCAGRMGQRIIALLAESPGFALGAGFEAPGHPAIGRDAAVVAGLTESGILIGDSPESAKGCRVFIDYSAPLAFEKNLEFCVRNGLALVVGTTGLSDSQKAKITEASGRIAIVHAPNMGVGINVLLSIVKQVAAVLGDTYDIEIIEAHHNKKTDAPSGTALGLAEAAAEGLGVDLKGNAVYGRAGQVGERRHKEIGIHAVRGGDIIGEHTVIFAGPGEKVEISHSVISRDVFAKGAVRAAAFLSGKKNGLFNMKDVLGLA
ncbi:MAG: 4-hydroxy-tetrahydrodipicolinate reductase [Fibrobacterota bacterium]